MTGRVSTAAAGMSLSVRGGAARRIGSLARGEALLLRRNPMALLTALASPVSFVLLVRMGQPADGDAALRGGAGMVTSLTAFALLSVVFYNLVTALVARREELVLKRLRTGEIRDAEILAGTAAPAAALAWGQIVIGLLAAVTVFGMKWPTNPVLVLVAVVLGTVVFTLLAAVCTALTRTVEMAQITATPVLLASALPGVLLPTDQLPEPLRHIAHLMPLARVVDLMHLGLTGTTPGGATVGLAASFGPAAIPVLVLAVWAAAGVWATRRWFRWEPRR
jgi:ABC-2 type transport system permease protein